MQGELRDCRADMQQELRDFRGDMRKELREITGEMQNGFHSMEMNYRRFNWRLNEAMWKAAAVLTGVTAVSSLFYPHCWIFL